MKRKFAVFGLATMLTLGTTAHAGWVYESAFQWLRPYSSQLDLNEDGITDISFTSYQIATEDNWQSSTVGFLEGNTHGNYVWMIKNYASPDWPYEGDFALPTSFGWWGAELYAPEGVWWKGNSSEYYESVFRISLYDVTHNLDDTWSGTGWVGPWADVDVACIALLFRDSTNRLHEAYIQLLLPDDSLFPRPAVLEFKYQTDPLPEPRGEISFLPVQDAVQFSFSETHKGLEYVLESTTNLTNEAWTTGIVFAAQSNTVAFTNSTDSNAKFWRLERVP